MDANLITIGIKSILRLARATESSLQQLERNKAALFPELDQPGFSLSVRVTEYYLETENLPLVEAGGPLANHWDGQNNQAREDAESLESLVSAMRNPTGETGAHGGEYLAASVFVAQYAPKNSPLSPWMRLAATAADVVLQAYVAYPAILEVDDRTEEILVAYASELASIFPDDGDWGTQHGFAERLGASFLKGALTVLAENPQWTSDKDHIQKLLTKSLKPLVEALPAEPHEQLVWRELTKTLGGPVAKAAFSAIATNPNAFLGDDFSSETIVGTVTLAFFEELAEQGVGAINQKDAWLPLFQAVAKVAAARPERFVDGEGNSKAFTRELIRSLGNVLQTATPPFNQDLGRSLTAATLIAISENVASFLTDDPSWKNVAIDIVADLTESFSGAITNNEALSTVLSKEAITEIGRTIVASIGKAPQLVVGDGKEHVHGVLQAVTKAMAEDRNLLLSEGDWREIASVAAEEAAANPARLFKLEGDDTLAAQMLGILFTEANAVIEGDVSRQHAVLYGETLKEAVITAIRAASGNSEAFARHKAELAQMIQQLNALLTSNPGKYGSKEWLHLFRKLLSALLSGATSPILNTAFADDLLKGA